MFINFDETLKNNESTYEIPKAIMDVLNDELPEGFIYKQIDEDTCIIDSMSEELKFEFELVNDIFKGVNSSEELLELSYRAQQPILVNTDKKIIINSHEFDVSDLMKAPLSNKFIEGRSEMHLCPPPFPGPFDLPLQLENGEKVILKIQRQPLADLNRSLFKSVGCGVLEISYTIYELKDQLQLTAKLNVENAKDVSELLKGIKLASHLAKESVMIGGVKLKVNTSPNFDAEDLSELIDIWEKVEKLSEILKVDFTPQASISNDEFNLINHLYKSLISNETSKSFTSIDTMTLNFTEEIDENKISFDTPVACRIENWEEISLLNCKFPLWKKYTISNFKINKIIREEGQEFTYCFKITPVKDEGVLEEVRYYLHKDGDETNKSFDALNN